MELILKASYPAKLRFSRCETAAEEASVSMRDAWQTGFYLPTHSFLQVLDIEYICDLALPAGSCAARQCDPGVLQAGG